MRETEPPLPHLKRHTKEAQSARLVTIARVLLGINVALLLTFVFLLEMINRIVVSVDFLPYLLPVPSLILSLGGFWYGIKGKQQQDGKLIAFVSALLFVMFFLLVLPMYLS